MFISKSEIPEAIEDQKQNILIYTANNLAIVNGMVPCVFSQQVSPRPRRWAVGWRFTKLGTKVGDIQEDCHATFDKAQTIEWVYEPSYKFGLQEQMGSHEGHQTMAQQEADKINKTMYCIQWVRVSQ